MKGDEGEILRFLRFLFCVSVEIFGRNKCSIVYLCSRRIILLLHIHFYYISFSIPFQNVMITIITILTSFYILVCCIIVKYLQCVLFVSPCLLPVTIGSIIYTQIYQCIYASLQAGPLEQAAEAGSSQCKHKHRDSQFQCIKQYYPCIYFIIQVGSILIIGTPIYPTYIKTYMCVYISPSYCQSIYLSPMLMKKQKQLNSIQVGENTVCVCSVSCYVVII